MDYEQFREQLAEEVQQSLYEKGAEGVNITFNHVEKMNESYDAMTVTPEGSNIGVNLNLDRFFEAYEDGVSFDEIVDRVTATVEKGMADTPAIDISMLTDYEQMRDKLVMEVVSAERNADLLAKVPHQEMEDMAIVYRFVMQSDEDGRATILVTNQLLDRFGVTPEQLHADAMENAPELKPAIIKGMSEVMIEMMGPDAAAMFGMDELSNLMKT